MRNKEALTAIAAFLGAVAIMAAAIGAFLVFVGDGSEGEAAPQRRVAASDESQQAATGATGQPTPRITPRPTRVSNETPIPAPKCLDPTACRTPTAEFAAAYNDPTACEGTTKRICLIPLGDVPKDLVDHLVAYYKSEYNLTLHVLPAVALESGFDSRRPGQRQAAYMEQKYTAAYLDPSRDRNVTMLGLTSLDIYTAERPEWNWFFGQMGDGHGVISMFRMDPLNWGEPKDDALRNKRVRTLMNKYVALGYYGLKTNNDPHSVLYQLIGGLDTLDGIDERIPVPR